MTRSLTVLALALALVGLPACGGGDGTGAPGGGDTGAGETNVAPHGYVQEQIDLAIEDESAFMIGTAVLAPIDEGSTRMTIFLDQYPESGATLELREGRCWIEDAPVERELGATEEGQAEFTIEQPLDELLDSQLALYVVGDGQDLGCAYVAPYGVDLD